jgi:glycosyltransferase involved in cell wall biosynthesis
LIAHRTRPALFPSPPSFRYEEQSLPSCLAALDGFSDIVVVDSGSTDATAAIAANAGAKVIQFHWSGGFPKKRNWVLQTFPFRTRWVLFIDADEIVTPAFKAELRAVLNKTDVAGYWLSYRNHFLGRVLGHGVRQRKLALFRVGAGLYERIDDTGWSAFDMEIHEHPVLDGPAGDIAAPLEHRDFRGLHHFIARHNEYSSWEARRYLALRGEAAAWSALTRRQRIKYSGMARWWYAPVYFFVTYVLRGGFLDGYAGFVYAILKFEYFFHIRCKIKALQAAEKASR